MIAIDNNWTLITGILTAIGIFLTLIVEYYRGVYIPRRERESDRINNTIPLYDTYLNEINYRVNYIIKENNFKLMRESLTHFDNIEVKIKKMIISYNILYEFFYDLCVGCSYVLFFLIEEYAKLYIPNLIKNYPILDTLKNNRIIQKLLDGEKMSLSWIRNIDYKYYHDIKRFLTQQDDEKTFDLYINELNNKINTVKILKRYSEEKTKLMNESNKIIKILEEEKGKLKNKLK